MNSFPEYAASFSLTFDHTALDTGQDVSAYFLYEGSRHVTTPGGHAFSHASERVIRMILTDVQLHRGVNLPWYTSPVLFAYGRDVIQEGTDPFIKQWDLLLSFDPFVQIKTSGAASTRPFLPGEDLFSFSFSALTNLIAAVNNFAGKIIGEVSLEEDEPHPFTELLKLTYERFSVEQKIATQAISGIHRCGIVLPMLVSLEEINPVDFCKGLISLRMLPPESLTETLAATSQILSYVGLFTDKSRADRPLAELIREGEGDSVEFKSTLRWDIRAGKTNPAIERSCLKTIAAFLNSSGGTLLIGVRDDGSAEGIETDKLANDDKFLLHLWTLVRNCLGRNISPCIRTKMEKLDDKTICRITCTPAAQPVFLRQAGYDEELFIRVGPSSNALDISEALKYISDHFSSR